MSVGASVLFGSSCEDLFSENAPESHLIVPSMFLRQDDNDKLHKKQLPVDSSSNQLSHFTFNDHSQINVDNLVNNSPTHQCQPSIEVQSTTTTECKTEFEEEGSPDSVLGIYEKNNDSFYRSVDEFGSSSSIVVEEDEGFCSILPSSSLEHQNSNNHSMEEVNVNSNSNSSSSHILTSFMRSIKDNDTEKHSPQLPPPFHSKTEQIKDISANLINDSELNSDQKNGVNCLDHNEIENDNNTEEDDNTDDDISLPLPPSLSSFTLTSPLPSPQHSHHSHHSHHFPQNKDNFLMANDEEVRYKEYNDNDESDSDNDENIKNTNKAENENENFDQNCSNTHDVTSPITLVIKNNYHSNTHSNTQKPSVYHNTRYPDTNFLTSSSLSNQHEQMFTYLPTTEHGEGFNNESPISPPMLHKTMKQYHDGHDYNTEKILNQKQKINQPTPTPKNNKKSYHKHHPTTTPMKFKKNDPVALFHATEKKRLQDKLILKETRIKQQQAQKQQAQMQQAQKQAKQQQQQVHGIDNKQAAYGDMGRQADSSSDLGSKDGPTFHTTKTLEGGDQKKKKKQKSQLQSSAWAKGCTGPPAGGLVITGWEGGLRTNKTIRNKKDMSDKGTASSMQRRKQRLVNGMSINHHEQDGSEGFQSSSSSSSSSSKQSTINAFVSPMKSSSSTSSASSRLLSRSHLIPPPMTNQYNFKNIHQKKKNHAVHVGRKDQEEFEEDDDEEFLNSFHHQTTHKAVRSMHKNMNSESPSSQKLNQNRKNVIEKEAGDGLLKTKSRRAWH